MRRPRPAAVVAPLLAAALVSGLASPSTAAPKPRPSDPTYWEYGGVYDCSKERVPPRTHTWTKASALAFVVIKHGKDYFVSDLGDANEGDRTYTFTKSIRFVISCEFTDA